MNTINKAINEWNNQAEPKRKSTVFEITDSEVYNDDEEPIELKLQPDSTLEIRSSQGRRPVLRLNNPIQITGDKNSKLILDGILIHKKKKTDNDDNNSLIDIRPGGI